MANELKQYSVRVHTYTGIEGVYDIINVEAHSAACQDKDDKLYFFNEDGTLKACFSSWDFFDTVKPSE